jgi:hypothetical protein
VYHLHLTTNLSFDHNQKDSELREECLFSLLGFDKLTNISYYYYYYYYYSELKAEADTERSSTIYADETTKERARCTTI